MSHFATTVALIGIVIIVASLLSGALERRGVPLILAFLGLGALLGPWGLGLVDIRLHSTELHVLATLGLALVLFSDAVTLSITELRSQRQLLLRLLGPGTIIPAVLVAVAAHLLLDLPWPAAAILGAALASTDPVLLRTMLRSPALPATPRVALRMETGMNDVVVLPIVVIAILIWRGAGTAPGANGEIARDVLGLFVLGPLLGALVGWVGITALSRVRSRIGVRRDYESLYALGLAFAAFAAAEAVGGSGFVAAFAAGLMVNGQDAELCDCFLEYGEATAEMLLLLTFVALGTTLIWSGLDVIDWRTLLFAAIALGVRTAVLYPVLGGMGISDRDRRLIALFGPRGLSSLLLTLLPVFAGVPGAERLFTIACLVVLISVLIHGVGIALFLRVKPSHAGTSAVVAEHAEPASVVVSGNAAEIATPERVTLEELHALRARGEPIVIVDARTERAYLDDPRTAAGAVRIHPDDPVRDATRLRLSKRATLVVYCA